MDEYIERRTLSDEIKSLTITVTGLHAGKGVLNEFMNQYRESVLRIIDEHKTVDVVPLALLEKWLYEIAFNNLGTGSQKDTAFAESCEEIINRLDGLRAFIRDETNN